jgi:hypothetical protein
VICRPDEITSGNEQKKERKEKNADEPTTLVVLDATFILDRRK